VDLHNSRRKEGRSALNEGASTSGHCSGRPWRTVLIFETHHRRKAQSYVRPLLGLQKPKGGYRFAANATVFVPAVKYDTNPLASSGSRGFIPSSQRLKRVPLNTSGPAVQKSQFTNLDSGCAGRLGNLADRCQRTARLPSLSAKPWASSHGRARGYGSAHSVLEHPSGSRPFVWATQISKQLPIRTLVCVGIPADTGNQSTRRVQHTDFRVGDCW
jgi:hypothetical protein